MSKRSWTHQKHSLEQRTAEVTELHNTYREAQTTELLDILQVLRDQKLELECQQQKVSERLEAVTDIVTQRWEQEGISSMKVNGQTFALKHKLYVSQANKEVWHSWLKENGHGDVIQPYVAPKTSEALVRELIETGQRVVFDEMGINVSFRTTLT